MTDENLYFFGFFFCKERPRTEYGKKDKTAFLRVSVGKAFDTRNQEKKSTG